MPHLNHLITSGQDRTTVPAHAPYPETPQTQLRGTVLYGDCILQHTLPVLHPVLSGRPWVAPLERSPQLGLSVMAVATWHGVNYHLDAGIQQLMSADMWVWVNKTSSALKPNHCPLLQGLQIEFCCIIIPVLQYFSTGYCLPHPQLLPFPWPLATTGCDWAPSEIRRTLSQQPGSRGEREDRKAWGRAAVKP